MTFNKILLLSGAAIILVAVGTDAEDADMPAFDGVYAGANAAVDWTKLSGDGKYDRSFYYGGTIGYRRQDDFGTVLGAEGSFGDNGYISHRTSANTDYEWSIAAIAGQTFGYGDRSLLYAKAGYSQLRIDDASGPHSDGGWLLGGGFERALASGLSVRTEVTYTTYGGGVKSWRGTAGLILTY